MDKFNQQQIKYAYNGKPQQWQWGFRAGYESRQADIDEYKTVAESIEDMYLIERKKLKAVEQILIELKDSMTNFKEMDLYDKGVRVVTDYIIRDLEKALRGKDQYTEHRTKAEQQINKGARLTKHQIDLGNKHE